MSHFQAACCWVCCSLNSSVFVIVLFCQGMPFGTQFLFPRPHVVICSYVQSLPPPGRNICHFRILALYSQFFKSLYWICYDPASVLCSVFLARRQVGPWLPSQGSNLHPCLGRGSLSHCTSRKVPVFTFYVTLIPPYVLNFIYCVSIMHGNRKAERLIYT